MENIVLTIIIPTRNRSQTLKFALESVKQNISLIPHELIIASNGDSLEGDLFGIPKELLDSARIVRSETRLSMGENWRFGFSFARGNWVHVMGDDDILLIRNPEKVNEILKRDDINGIVFRFGTFSWTINSDGRYTQNSFWEPEETLEFEKIESKMSTLRTWEELHPRSYPNGTGSSLIRRKYLDNLEYKDMLFAAVSPDWFTGAYFAFSNSIYLKCDLLWSSIGAHPESSIYQIYNPSSIISKKEAKIQKFQIHKSLSSPNGTFPTTWLIRLDSIIRARELLGMDTSISQYRLIKNALDTTPRYVFRVGRQLMADKGSRIPITISLLLPAFVGSVWKKFNL